MYLVSVVEQPVVPVVEHMYPHVGVDVHGFEVRHSGEEGFRAQQLKVLSLPFPWE